MRSSVKSISLVYYRLATGFALTNEDLQRDREDNFGVGSGTAKLRPNIPQTCI
jgi:hypothetical protein